MIKILQYILSSLLIMLLASFAVNAATCKLNSAEAILNISDDITLHPAEKGAAGAVLWSKTFTMPDVKYVCNTDSTTLWRSTYSRNYISTAQDNVYATEVAGVGIRIKWPASGAGVWVPGNSSSLVCKTGCSMTGTTVLIEFVQTGTISQGDSSIPAGEIAKAAVSPTTDPNDKLQIMTINFGSSIKVVTFTCSVYPSNTNIDLGTYNLSYFQNSVSAQGEKKPYSLTFTCPQTTAITVMFTSLPSPPYGSATGVIGVEEGDGYANGFSVRLYEKASTYVSNPVKIGTDYTFTVQSSLTKSYEAQIYIPTNIDRSKKLGAGRIVGVVQYTIHMD